MYIDACGGFTKKSSVKFAKKIASVLRNFGAYAKYAHFLYCLLYIESKFSLLMQGSWDGGVGKAAAKEKNGPGFESGLDIYFFLFFLRIRQIFFCNFFCVNSTHALTHASNLRNCARSYNERKFDAQSAHVARLRRYCANHKVAQFRRKIGAFWVVGRGNETSLFSLFFPISPPSPSFDDAIFEKKRKKKNRGKGHMSGFISAVSLPPPPFSKEPPPPSLTVSPFVQVALFSFFFFAFKCAPTSPNPKTSMFRTKKI